MESTSTQADEKKARMRAYMKQYQLDHAEELRVKRLAYRKRPYVREKANAYRRKHYQSPEVRARARAYVKQYNNRPEVKARENARMKERYHSDPVYRQKVLTKNRERQKAPLTIIRDSRRQYEQLCEKDPKEAENLLKDMESEEGKDFRELMLDGIPEKKGIIKSE